MKYIKILVFLLLFTTLNSCNKYLDVVPDNVPTLEYAFRMRTTAQKFLNTCYSYLPNLGSRISNPAFFGADELWLPEVFHNNYLNWHLAKGQQNINSPVLKYWGGGNNAENLWQGISQCNIFLEEIESVPDMDDVEKRQWIAEVKFLKAFYHFFLLRAYGPIPIMKENLPISASGEEVRVFRQPVDDVFNYIIELIDEATVNLPDRLFDENTEYGRITLPIALGMKAKILTYQASPLFNGNPDYVGFKDKNGVQLFSTAYDPNKWQIAADALKEAIDMAHSLGHQLYHFELTGQTRDVSGATLKKLDIRGIVTDRWNDEILWSHTGSSTTGLQEWVTPMNMSSETRNTAPNGGSGVPLNIVSLFYTKNGVPIDEDINWNYSERFNFRTGGEAQKYYIKEGETTVELHFDREPRFYGSLGFDRGIWYGQGKYDDNDSYWLELRSGEFSGKTQAGRHSVTGYYAKKLAHYTNVNTTTSSYSMTNYPWVMLRLGDLYLLYAEALNEINGPSQEVYRYLDLIRERAGIPGVEVSWQYSSRNPNKVNNKDGLREIIQRERAIEMAFEGERFWDLRRWKTAPQVLNSNITGWDVDQSTQEGFYRQRILFNQTFSLKDYFWPISERDLIVNKNLVQNPGW